MFASGYQADLDVNMDGAVDSKDSGVVSKLRGRSLGAGELSDRGNIVGWCGYLYEEATGMWLARHRWQIPELGRWANRDPIGYAGGGQNLYEYVNGNPVVLQDPSGLIGGFFDMIGEGFQQAKSDIGNWLFDTDIEEVHEQQTDNHYNICDNFRKRLGMGRDEECQTEEEWEEQKANLHAAYANNGCDGPPVLTDFGEIAIDALKESAHGFITGDPEHWNEVQDYLDWGGMAPGVGIIADGMNLAISLVRGNWSRALWSASAMVPGWGNASQGVRFGLRNGSGTALPFVRQYERHHSYPLFMGGPKAQQLTTMEKSRHRRLHRDLNRHLQGRKYTDPTGRNMRPTRSNRGVEIREAFSERQRRNAMRDFYNTPRYYRRYRDAAEDFFRQFGRR